MIEPHGEEEVEGDVASAVLDIPDPLMVLIPGGNGSLSGTVAVTERKNTGQFLTVYCLGNQINVKSAVFDQECSS